MYNTKQVQRNQGVAMIVAVVVSMVLMVFALALLLVAYSLFSTVNKGDPKLQCKELAKSIDKELEEEITKDYFDYAEQQAAATAGENRLWFFLRYNMWQEHGWNYFNEDEKVSEHGTDAAYRYFTLDSSDASQFGGAADTILITMYWECDADTYEEASKEETPLHVRIKVTKAEEAYSIDTTYLLGVSQYDDVTGDGEIGCSDTSLNPQGNEIVQKEKWHWMKEED